MLPPARLLSAFLFFALCTSCADSHLEEYEEPVTSMFYVLTPDSGQKVVLSFIDNDGIGGSPALVNSGALAANVTYQGQLIIGMRNPLAQPRLSHIIDSTSVTAEPTLHQVFFEPANGLQLTTTYTDTDENGNAIGLETTLQTGSISDGQLVISIIHEPNKSGTNVINGDRTHAGGSIDAEATFSISIR